MKGESAGSSDLIRGEQGSYNYDMRMPRAHLRGKGGERGPKSSNPKKVGEGFHIFSNARDGR